MARGRFKKPGKIIAPIQRVHGAQLLERQVISKDRVSIKSVSSVTTSQSFFIDTLKVQYIYGGNVIYVTDEAGNPEVYKVDNIFLGETEPIFLDDLDLWEGPEDFYLVNNEAYIIN